MKEQESQLKYYIIFKPFGMMSQFSPEGEKSTLADLNFEFPKDVYPVGRLDHDSEGLLLLTNDKKLNHRLLDPEYKHWRTYWVQVEGDVTPEAIKALKEGVDINLKGKIHHTLPARVKKIEAPGLPERVPPIRERKSIPTSWIEISLCEGKNRQVRRMTAKVAFPTLRLLRSRIESLTIQDMMPGDVSEIPFSIIDQSVLKKERNQEKKPKKFLMRKR
ncbi:MAG: pseudouridine synthase [Bacteroidales bacterium]|nr:pseudouridine synthase [Bacteroidales bacterium]